VTVASKQMHWMSTPNLKYQKKEQRLRELRHGTVPMLSKIFKEETVVMRGIDSKNIFFREIGISDIWSKLIEKIVIKSYANC